MTLRSFCAWTCTSVLWLALGAGERGASRLGVWGGGSELQRLVRRRLAGTGLPVTSGSGTSLRGDCAIDAEDGELPEVSRGLAERPGLCRGVDGAATIGNSAAAATAAAVADFTARTSATAAMGGDTAAAAAATAAAAVAAQPAGSLCLRGESRVPGRGLGRRPPGPAGRVGGACGRKLGSCAAGTGASESSSTDIGSLRRLGGG